MDVEIVGLGRLQQIMSNPDIADVDKATLAASIGFKAFITDMGLITVTDPETGTESEHRGFEVEVKYNDKFYGVIVSCSSDAPVEVVKRQPLVGTMSVLQRLADGWAGTAK